ncbi:hypothetical protein PJ985_01100 [Streptomyces sp. ACA25]|uniref:hypothetical protein n=1 Tax=Streptomyces sp. ACA25 TaxID=3022596 RepID=UPI002307FC6A|nr:hypothetical protein [Streptomyces sp. ACA25]MDB1086171.1 hypothetical protein [Streptomyces sp. ACA25]
MPYESAHDLPSFIELKQQLKGVKLFQFLIPKERRLNVEELQEQIQRLGDLADRFYVVLGERNWIFHDDLSITKIEEILNDAPDAATAEARLIGYYQNENTLKFMMLRLRSMDALRKREHLVRYALDDYKAGRYYACTHVLLSVMDGFVNEFETVRRGLHARKPEELDGWDSIIGHHRGLARVHKVFTKGRTKPNENPVYELHRNGIVHGSILNFNNEVVATKAWNYLFAVVDWAKAKEKASRPKPEQPSWADTFKKIADNGRVKRALDEWQPENLGKDSDGFTSHKAYEATDRFLTSWRNKNYGGMAQSVNNRERDAHGNGFPRLIRQSYEGFDLESFEINFIDHRTAAICVVSVKLFMAGGEEKEGKLRWVYESPDGEPTPSSMDGEWHLVHWNYYMVAGRT